MHPNGCVRHCSKQQYAGDVSVSPHPPSISYNLATQIVLSILACRKERGKLTTSHIATCIVFEQSGWIATPCVDMQMPIAMALAAYAELWSRYRTGLRPLWFQRALNEDKMLCNERPTSPLPFKDNARKRWCSSAGVGDGDRSFFFWRQVAWALIQVGGEIS